MKEEGQKKLENALALALKSVVVHMQKMARGYLARQNFKILLEAKRTMYKIFLNIAMRMKWKKIIN
jgi:hypothetical protein